MASVFSKYLQVFNAKQFKESVSETSSSNVYLTFGRCFAWSNDASPFMANTSVLSHYDVWTNMIGGKKVTGNDIRHCIPRFNWATGTVYYAYNDLTDSRTLKNSNTQFYVVTDDWNVYKCLANNYGATSTYKPTSISTTTDFQTADGYVWKYMYTVSAEERLRFVTNNYIPVKTLNANEGSLQWAVQNNAISGAIHSILLTNFGSNYTANDIYITITGDGQDANAYAIRNVTANTISTIVIDNKGINYTYANVLISSATGSAAAGRAIISPPGGHGSDPLIELGGSNLIINQQFKNDENGKFPITNEYRQLCLIEEPKIYNSSNSISNTVVSQTTLLSLNGTSAEYVEDEFVYQGTTFATATFSARVVEWNSSNNTLRVTNTRGLPTSQLVLGATSGAGRFLSSVTYPDMQPYSGNLLYIDNVTPISRTSDQTEDFKIILNF